MLIFYDFETSSKELLGQILSYSFIVTDYNYKIIEELNGTIKLNRLQLPDIDAILTNRIDVIELQNTGIEESETAKKIFAFLNKQVNNYQKCTLVGYNSNSFDLSFLRNLLIRYGINPYFSGKLKNLDILHYVQHSAFQNPEKFKWSLESNKKDQPYYSFRLETISKNYQLLDGQQTHAARDDVLLVINLVKTLESEFGLKLTDFTPIEIPKNELTQEMDESVKQRQPDYNSGENLPQKYIYKYWLKLFSSPKEKIMLDLEKYEKIINSQELSSINYEKQIASCIRYINHNKHFFVVEALSDSEYSYFAPTFQQTKEDPVLKSLTKEKYFELIKKNWDIEYQIHELGFERIDLLHKYTKKLLQDSSSYTETLQELIKNRNSYKDNYLIQLYNRIYLNYHPQAKPEYISKYITPRYVTGHMLKNPEEFISLQDYRNRLEDIIKNSSSPEDISLAKSLKQYYYLFCEKNINI